MRLLTLVKNLSLKSHLKLFQLIRDYRISMIELSSWCNGKAFPNNFSLYLLGVILHPYLYAVLYGYCLALYLRLFARDKTVVVVWDYEVMPTKFGDYIWGLTVCKLLALYCRDVHFIELLSKNGTFFKKDATKNEPAAINFLKSRAKLQSFFGDMSNIRYQTVLSHDTLMGIIKQPNTFVVLRNHIVNRKYVLHYYHNLISSFYSMLPKNEKVTYITSLKAQKKDCPYLFATHVRYNPNRPEKDRYVKATVDILDCIKGSIFVASDSIGISYLEQKVASSGNSARLVFRPDSDYCADIDCILSSNSYFQYRGGGVGGPVASSTKQPYIIAQIGGFLVPAGPSKMFSFSLDNQLFTTNLDFIFFKKFLFSSLICSK